MRIIIADDDRLVTAALKTILEVNEDIEVAATCCDGGEAVSLFGELRPDVLLTDIRMKKVSGLEASELILKEHPDARILLLTTFLDDEYIVRALKLGVKGYLIKQDYESILPALRAVYSGQVVFGKEIVEKLPDLLQKGSSFDCAASGLTEREGQVLRLIAEGMSNKEIAGELFLGEGTVRNLVSGILEKLALRDRTQLAVYYYKNLPSGAK